MSAEALERLLREAHRAYTGRPPLPPLAGAADPTTVGVSTAAINSATSATLAKPAGVAAGDVIIINYGGNGTGGASTQEGAGDAALTPPAGFTTYHHYCGSGNNWLVWVMYRVADGTEGSSFTPHTSSAITDGGAVLTVIRGLDTATPILSVSASDSVPSSPHHAFATSTSGYNATVSMIASVGSEATGLAFPAGWNDTTDGGHADNGSMFADIACNLTSQNSVMLPTQAVTYTTGGYVILNQFALRVAGSARTNVAVLQPPVAAESSSLAFPIAVQEGSTLIAGLMRFDGATATPTDTLGLTWTLITGSRATGPGGTYETETAFYTATVPTDGAGPRACTVTGFTTGFDRVVLCEVLGDIDVRTAHYGTDSGGTHGNDAGTFTPTKDGAFIVGMWAANGTNGWAPESYWTMLIQDTAGAGGTAIGFTTQTTAAAFDVGITTGNTGLPYSASGVAIVPHVTGTASSSNASDSFSITDSTIRGGLAQPRGASDSFAIGDSGAARGGLGQSRGVVDSFAVGSSSTRAATGEVRQAQDSIPISDSAHGLSGIGRFSSDVVNFSDSDARLTAAARGAVDAIGFGDSSSRQASSNAGTSDSISFTDSARIGGPAQIFAGTFAGVTGGGLAGQSEQRV